MLVHQSLPWRGLHNTLHNMDDEMPFASHVIRRGRIYQYVRRIPEDIAAGYPFSRIQRSLRTSDRVRAYEAAAGVHAEIEKQFAAARRKKGRTLNVISVEDWDWPDWQQLADWLKAVLIEDDWQARLKNLSGAVFHDGVKRSLFWRDNKTLRDHIDLQKRLTQMTVSSYAEERLAFVQSLARRIGVPVSKSMPYFERFMAACLRAETEYLAVFLDREGGNIEASHCFVPRPRFTISRLRCSR